MDLTGQPVFASETEGFTLTWTPTGIASGLYIYKAYINTGGKIIETKLDKLLILN